MFDDMMDEIDDKLEDVKSSGGIAKTLRRIGRKTSFIVAVLAVIVIAVLGFLYQRSHARQAELELQVEQQTQTLERLNDVIDGLREKQNEQDRLIKDSVPVINSEQLKEEISALSELVTQQYIYTNADKYENDQTWIFGWTRPFSSKSIMITYDGTIKAGIDMSEVLVDVDTEKNRVTITLPETEIFNNDIPPETITVVEVKDGLFNEVTFDNYNKFITEQKLVMEQKVRGNGFMDEARKEAKELIKSFVSVLPGMENYKLIIE